MFAWIYEEKIPTHATPESVWHFWSELESWSQWDADVAWAELETTFSQGKYIRMKPVKGPKVRCLLAELTPLRSFTTRSQFPFTTLSFIHHMEDGVVTHRVELHGLLTPVLKRLFGRDIQKGLPQTVRSLVSMAENRTAQGPR